MLRLILQMFAEDAAPAGDGSAAESGTAPETTPAGNETGSEENKGGDDAKALAAQIEQLKADLAKQKNALDAATSEAGKYRKELQKRQTQEEIDAAAKEEAAEKAAKELEELRRKVARAESTKAVMAKLNLGEDEAGKIAESMVGCENIENALLLIQKAWTAREKALKLEYGKIPGPGTGGSNEEDAEQKAAIERAKELGKARAESNRSVTEGLKGYIR